MGRLGESIGGFLGGLGSDVLPIPGINGSQFGGFLGSLLPFARGGQIPPYKKGGMVRRKFQKSKSKKKSRK